MREISQLVGYDIRHAPASFVASRWDEASRETYLLRPKIKYPLSVTARVWPSIFDDPQGSFFSFPEGIRVEEGVDWYWDAFRLWKNLEEMVQAGAVRGAESCGIAIGLVPRELYPGPPSSMTDDWLKALLDEPCRPASPASGWQRLGYDVTDTLSISAICDCASIYPEEREEQRKRWGESLNEFGLFDAVSDACTFCVHANTSIPEHAPFLVFELFLIWGVNQLG